MENLKPPNELDLSPNGRTTVAEKWRQWKQTMQLFIDLTMSKNTEKEKCSAFSLHHWPSWSRRIQHNDPQRGGS